MWCPITGSWVPKSFTKAAHIFAYHHGQDMMAAIFGDEAIGELFSPKNGILMSQDAEERFDKGLFVIVPDINDSSSQIETNRWNNSNPREYKIRVLNPESAQMTKLIGFDPSPRRRWNDLDGQRLQFRSDYRPRARYLYFHYCTSILRRSWNQNQHWDLLKKELGQKVWATRGRYLSKSQLLGFVEELGHEVGPSLLRGAKDPESNVEADETALAAANDQIRVTAGEASADLSEVMSTTLEDSDDEYEGDSEGEEA
jgi:HNH endonuclease